MSGRMRSNWNPHTGGPQTDTHTLATTWQYLLQLSICPQPDPAILLLGGNGVHMSTCTRTFPAVAKNWRQFKSAEEGINRSRNIHTRQDYTAIKKKKIEVLLHASNTDESHRRNVSKKNKNKRIPIV